MKKKVNTFSVLIPDGDSPLLFNVLNCFSLTNEVDVYIMSKFKNNPFKYSQNIKHFVYNPKPNSPMEWISNINKVLGEFNIDIVMPILESSIKILIENKDLIYLNRLVNLPTRENFNTALNKALLKEHLVVNKIQKPNSFIIKSGGSFDNNKIKFPVLIKPTIDSGGGKSIKKFSNREEVEKYFIDNNFDFDYLVEEFIQGRDYCFNVLCHNGKILAYSIHKGNKKEENDFGPSVGFTFLYDDSLYQLAAKLMKSLNWSGVANIDVIYDEIANEFRILEINPRFWYNVDASSCAGVNFPYLYCLQGLDVSFQNQKYNFIEYLNLNGIIRKIKKNKLFIFNFKLIFKNSQLPFFLKDPFPLIYGLISGNRIK